MCLYLPTEPVSRPALFCPTGRRRPRDPGCELHVTGAGEGNEGTGAEGEAQAQSFPLVSVHLLIPEGEPDGMTSSFQLGIRISMSHEEEPLGTGQWRYRQTVE